MDSKKDKKPEQELTETQKKGRKFAEAIRNMPYTEGRVGQSFVMPVKKKS